MRHFEIQQRRQKYHVIEGGQQPSVHPHSRFRVLKLTGAFLAASTVIVLFWKLLSAPEHLSHTSGSSAANKISHKSFEMTLHTFLPEIQCDLVMYRHRKTQTEILTLIPEDLTQDSTFGISFRTIPDSNTGVPHILEHSVLAGSAKYRLKDPFNALLEGSLQTFLNAMTYDDRTLYLLSSRNGADFRNLVSVYLDAVFKPLAVTKEGSWVFRQEGWRVEQDENGDLSLNGVVLSEMKGAYSDPDELILQHAQENLFPDTSYRFDSGGEPMTIPTLKFDEFVAFYEKFYHPTNAQVFFFGPVEHIKNGMEQTDAYLNEYDARPDISEASRVSWQNLTLEDPVRVQKPYPSSSDEGDYRVLVSWLLNDHVVDTKTELAWYVITELLLGTPSSVLYKALTNSALGDDVIDDGLSNQLQQMTFHVGMQGVQNSSQVEKVEKKIMDTLQIIVSDGFGHEEMASAINTVEFQLRELATGGYPRGIAHFMSCLSKWNYGQDPQSAFEFEDALNELKSSVEESGSTFFTSIIRHQMVFNTHRVITELYPSSTLEQTHAEEEKAFLKNLENTPDELQKLLDDFSALKEIQATDDTPEALEAIPVLSLDDVDATGEEYPIITSPKNDVLVISHPVESSFNIAYVDFGLDMSMFQLEDVALVPLLCRLVLESGTSTYSEVALAHQIGMYTGGIDILPLILSIRADGESDEAFIVSNGSHLSSKIFVRGKCMTESISQMFDLFGEILFQGLPFAQEKTIALLKEMVAKRHDAVKSRGHKIAMHAMEAHYSVGGYVSEQLSGASSLQELSEALETAKSQWDVLLGRLENMRDTLLSGNRNGMVLNLTGDKNVLALIDDAVNVFLQKIVPTNGQNSPFPDFSKEEHPWAAEAKQKMSELGANDGFVTSTRVSYVGNAGVLYQPGEQVPGSAAVVAHFLETGYLYENLRLQRGAYGAFTVIRKDTGLLEFLSYRDPNLAETLQVYDGVASALSEEITSAEELSQRAKKIIIGTIGNLDGSAPQPDQIGWESLCQYLWRETAKQRQKWRKQILQTDRDDYLEFAQRLSEWASPSIAAVSSQDTTDEAVALGFNLTLTNLER